MTEESVTPEQPPSGPLYARQSDETPLVGPSRGAGGASGPQTGTQGLRPRSERCPDPECTDENQCWRCDYEESQAAGRTPTPTTLREQYAAAIASYDHAVGHATDPAPRDHHYGQADAALAVRDRELDQLRAQVARVRAELDALCREPHPSHDHVCPDDVRRSICRALNASA